jgi:hypothetical protein
MNTKTQERIERIISIVRNASGNDGLMRDALLIQLKEQDRDTRHACAERSQAAILNREAMTLEEAASTAHDACINAQSV